MSSPVVQEEENGPETSRAHSWVDGNAADGHSLLLIGNSSRTCCGGLLHVLHGSATHGSSHHLPLHKKSMSVSSLPNCFDFGGALCFGSTKSPAFSPDNENPSVVGPSWSRWLQTEKAGVGVGCSRDSGGRGTEGVRVTAPSGSELESDECHLLSPSKSLP